MTLPAEYVAYLSDPSSIIEGVLDRDPYDFVLWPLAEVEGCNHDLNVATYAPGFLGFGGNGGGELLAFDESGAVFMLPMVGLSSEQATKISDSWTAFTAHIQPDAA